MDLVSLCLLLLLSLCSASNPLFCSQAAGMYNIDTVQAMAFDGCYHEPEPDIDFTTFSVNSTESSTRERAPSIANADAPRIKRKRSLRGNVGRIILQNNHVIDTYSRIIFPIVYIVFNFFYWGLYIWMTKTITNTFFIWVHQKSGHHWIHAIHQSSTFEEKIPVTNVWFWLLKSLKSLWTKKKDTRWVCYVFAVLASTVLKDGGF